MLNDNGLMAEMYRKLIFMDILNILYAPAKLYIHSLTAFCSAALFTFRRWAFGCNDWHLRPAMFQARLSVTRR